METKEFYIGLAMFLGAISVGVAIGWATCGAIT